MDSFDTWSQLAKDSPDAFEERRRQVIEDFINSVPVERQQRLRQLQWKIDQVRNLSRTPMAACIAINSMMWDSVLGKGGLHEVLNGALSGTTISTNSTAKILPFGK